MLRGGTEAARSISQWFVEGGPRTVALLLGGAYGLLLTTWALSNPPGASPDEPAHFVKLVGISDGQVAGSREPWFQRSGISPGFLAFWDQTTRGYNIPANLVPDDPGCVAFHPAVSAGCLNVSVAGGLDTAHEQSYVGAYEPLDYMPGALLVHLAPDGRTGILLGRLGFVAINAVLLLLAALVLTTGTSTGVPLLGLMVAVTPMLLFMGSQIQPSGVEVSAAIAYVCALLALCRPDGWRRWFPWAVLGAAGIALATSRATGPIWVIAGLLIPAALVGPRASLRLVRSSGRRAAVGLGALVLGVMADISWWSYIGRPSSLRPLADARYLVLSSFDRLIPAYQEQVGVFGWLDTRLPGLVYLAWASLVVALVTMALLATTRRGRLVMAVSIGAVVVGGGVLYAALIVLLNEPVEYVQGRYIMALSVVVPLVAAELLAINYRRLWPQRPGGLAVSIGVTVAIAQLWAVYINARRYAVGVDGPLFFVGRSDWRPPLGWAVYLLAAVLAAAGIAVAGFIVARCAWGTAPTTAPS
jgi:hypothetical protein